MTQRNILIYVACILTILTAPLVVENQLHAQSNPNSEQIEAPQQEISKVEIKPKVRDGEIGRRIQSILEATKWYDNPVVRVEDGVVFITGQTKTAEYKQWAEELAQKTEYVVAVVNKIKVVGPASWYFQQIASDLQQQWQNIIRGLPFLPLHC